jgi:hypothetical protein
MGKYITYGIVNDGIYIFDMKLKKQIYHFYLQDKMNYVYPTSILSFTIENLLFINHYNDLYNYNWRTKILTRQTFLSNYTNPKCCQLFPRDDGTFETNKDITNKLLYETYNGNCYDYDLLEQKINSSKFIKPRIIDNKIIYKSKYNSLHSSHSDTRGYKFYISLEYFVEIYDKSDNLIWVDYDIIDYDIIEKFENDEIRSKKKYKKAQLCSVSLLDSIDADIIKFRDDIYLTLNVKTYCLSRNITNIVSKYLVC